MSKLTDQGERLLGQLEQSTQRFNQLLSSDNQHVVMTTLSNLGKAAADLQQLTNQSRQILPELTQTALETLATVKTTSVRVGDSADSARTSARAFQKVTDRMYAPGGTLDQIGQGTDILVATGQTLQSTTLPRLNRAVVEATRTLQHLAGTAQTLNDNPQALLLGKPGASPGPGEPGFVTDTTSPR
jgi:phospholipid/cholesterol/gamma-HCH transport system substrate-binding protein